MLVLTLERWASKRLPCAAVRHAEQIATLDPTRAVIALSQYQGARRCWLVRPVSIVST
jgi:hypothetical protein